MVIEKVSEELANDLASEIKCYICINHTLNDNYQGLKISFDSWEELAKHLSNRHTMGALVGRILQCEKLLNHVKEYK